MTPFLTRGLYLRPTVATPYTHIESINAATHLSLTESLVPYGMLLFLSPQVMHISRLGGCQVQVSGVHGTVVAPQFIRRAGNTTALYGLELQTRTAGLPKAPRRSTN